MSSNIKMNRYDMCVSVNLSNNMKDMRSYIGIFEDA
jgi:hypothetical protein